MILAIDDLQWGDVDSAILLSDLLCSPQSPVLLFMGCFRSEDAADEARSWPSSATRSRRGPRRSDHRELAVEALTQSEARELALALLDRDDAVARAQAHMVARESGGNPLFIDELVRHIQSGGPIDRWEAIGQLDLDEVLWARIPSPARGRAAAAGRRRGLGPADPPGAGLPGRRAGGRRPRGTGVAADRAADPLDRAKPRRKRSRPTTTGSARRWSLTCRRTALRWHHERLAMVLATAGPVDPEVLAGHYRGAGDLARGVRVLFTRGRPGRRGPGLRPRRAALSDRDRAARGPDGAGAAAPEEARRRAGQRRPRGRGGAGVPERGRGGDGRRDPGTQAAGVDAAPDQRACRRGPGAPAHPAGPAGHHHARDRAAALASLLWHRRAAPVPGPAISHPRGEARSPPMDLTRIDLCWSAVAGLSMFEPIRGADFQARGLLLALRAGEPLRIARAMAMEAGHRSTAGTADPQVSALLHAAEEIAQTARFAVPPRNDRHGSRSRALSCGQVEARADARSMQAEQLFRNHAPESTWERDTVHNFVLWALIQRGEMAELQHALDRALPRISESAGDLYAGNDAHSFLHDHDRLSRNEAIESQRELEASHRSARQQSIQPASFIGV